MPPICHGHTRRFGGGAAVRRTESIATATFSDWLPPPTPTVPASSADDGERSTIGSAAAGTPACGAAVPLLGLLLERAVGRDHRSLAGRCGYGCPRLTGSVVSSFPISTAYVAPSNGGRPLSISYRITPHA